MEKEQYDSLILRCPSLGGEVPFIYCRKVNHGGPCRRLSVCWEERFDVLVYIQKFYSQEEIDRYFVQTGPGRLGQILGQLERVGEMKKEENKRNELIDAIHKEAREGRITCAKAWLLADQFDYPKHEIGTLLNELKIKITKCQIGCF